MSSTPRAYTHFPSQADLFYFCTTSSTSEEDLNIHYAPPSKSSLKIGVLVTGQDQLQLLDLAAVDLLAMISRNRISKYNAADEVLEEAVDEIDIRYISESGEGSFPITSFARMPVTNSFEDAPQFDVLIIPGSFSAGELPTTAASFVTTQSSSSSFTALMSISSGIQELVQSGSLHQKRATCPATMLSALRHRFPETSWQETPWVRQDKIWSSRSAISGLDMVAAWMREYFWDRSTALECALSTAGIAPLDDYE